MGDTSECPSHAPFPQTLLHPQLPQASRFLLAPPDWLREQLWAKTHPFWGSDRFCAAQGWGPTRRGGSFVPRLLTWGHFPAGPSSRGPHQLPSSGEPFAPFPRRCHNRDWTRLLGLLQPLRPWWHSQASVTPAGPHGPPSLAGGARHGEEAGGQRGHGLYAPKSPRQLPPSPGINKMAAGAPKWRRLPRGARWGWRRRSARAVPEGTMTGT